MNVFKRSAFVCVLIAGLPGNATPVFGVASFQVLGILPPVGDGQADSSVALGVSADGSAVVGDSRWSQGVQAFRWTSAEGMTGLGDLPTGSFDSHARGASTNGNVVVGRGRSANGEEAFRWTSATGMVGLGALPSGGFTSDAVGVSADGGVVVGTSNRSSGEGQAFRWTASTGMVGLDGGSWTTLANGVSGSGSVVVGQRHSPGGGEAFMWSEASGIVGLGFLPGVTPQSTALGVSEDGSVVVGYSHRSPNGLEAFRWTSDTGMVGLGVLPGCDTSYALSVSADGQTIVGESRWQNGYRTAVIWDSVHGVRSLEEVLEQDHGLDLHGWSLINATAVSADGLTIVGQGVNPQNHWEAWRAVLPEPAALSLVIVGGLALSRRRGARGAAIRNMVACLLIVGMQGTAANAVNIDLVTVGNPGNAGELSGAGAGGYGPDRICGAVGYTYQMGKFEVTAGQYAEFLNAVAKVDPYGLYNTRMASGYACNISQSGTSGSYTYAVAADWANRPVNFVTWGDAARFANWLTNGQPTGAQDLSTTEDGSYYLDGANDDDSLMAVTRKVNARCVIPTEDEWYKAAYHKNDGVTGSYFDYPTSSDRVPSNLLSNPTDPGNTATYRPYGADYTIGSPYYRTEVGAHGNSSPYGTFDQGGNIHEWNETKLSTDLTSTRGLRGGSFGNMISTDDLLASVRGSCTIPTNDDKYFGFRVAYVPEPATLALLVVGGLSLMPRRTLWRC